MRWQSWIAAAILCAGSGTAFMPAPLHPLGRDRAGLCLSVSRSVGEWSVGGGSRPRPWAGGAMGTKMGLLRGADGMKGGPIVLCSNRGLLNRDLGHNKRVTSLNSRGKAEQAEVVSQMEAVWRDARVRRVVAWVLFAGICVLLTEFYGVIVGTFMLSFLGNSVVSFLEQQADLMHQFTASRTKWNLPKLKRETLSLCYICVTMAVITFVWVIMSDNPYVSLAESIHVVLGDDATARLESLLTGIMGSFTPTVAVKKGVNAPSLLSTQLQRSLKGYLIAALPTVQRLIRSSGAFFYQANISLLFSFVLIYDKARITRGVRRLGQDGSLVSWAYKELAPQIKLFGKLVGKSLEAQFIIAIWNTFLTSAGMAFLGLPGVPVLASLVFVCSFIPLAGVAISTFPMALVALSEGGPTKCLGVFGMVFFVHVLEAYFLNPQIYSSKLKLHPLLVLISLYVTEHIAGVTALFLAVPVTVFMIQILLNKDVTKTARLMPDVAEAVPELTEGRKE